VTFLSHPPFQQSVASCSLGLQSGQGKNEHIFSPHHLPRSYPIYSHQLSLVLFLHDLRLLLVFKEAADLNSDHPCSLFPSPEYRAHILLYCNKKATAHAFADE
jgi:hypothetical protein